MTQLQTMSDQELNRKLAELMGYKIGRRVDYGFKPEYDRDVIALANDRYMFIPDYCTDPAASLEVQAKAIEVDEPEYFTQLLALKGVLDNYSLFAALNAVALASPRDRAEAAYMTLQAYQVDKQ